MYRKLIDAGVQRPDVAAATGAAPGTVAKWFQRERIPDKYSADLADLLAEKNEAASMTETAQTTNEDSTQVTEKSTESLGITGFNKVNNSAPVSSGSVESLFEKLLVGTVGSKDGTYYVRGFCDGTRCDENMRKLQLIIVDGDSSIDNPNSSVDPKLVHAAMTKHKIRHVIHTSFSHDPENNINKFRLIVPCENLTVGNLKQGVAQIISLMHSEGLPIKPVGENTVLSQPWYMARFPKQREQFFFSAEGKGHVFEISSEIMPVTVAKPAPTTPTDEQFTWQWFKAEINSGTLHQPLKGAVCFLMGKNPNWTDHQIRKEILTQISKCDCDPDKLKRAESWELDGMITWARDTLKKGHLPRFSSLVAGSPEAVEISQSVGRLAELSDVEYEVCRKGEAKRLKLRAGVLDKARSDAQGDGSAKVENLCEFKTQPVWDKPVDGKVLISELVAIFDDYLRLPPGGSLTAALWTIFTYAHREFWLAPILLVTSPVMRCGKSSLMRLLKNLCFQAYASENISVAALFRIVDATGACCLLDEVDTFVHHNEDLRGLINSGYERDSGGFARCDSGENNYQVRQYSTFSPKALAMIKQPQDTIVDRSIAIPLQRKLTTDVVKKFSRNKPAPLIFEEMRAKISRFVDDNLEDIKTADPKPPTTASDRHNENWAVLLVIASVCGTDVETEARLFANSVVVEAEAEPISIQLLKDIRDIFDQMKEINGDAEEHQNISSEALTNALILMPEAPWREVSKRGEQLTQHLLAKMLSDFKIRSKSVRYAGGTPKGYSVHQFKNTFTRYLPR